MHYSLYILGIDNFDVPGVIKKTNQLTPKLRLLKTIIKFQVLSLSAKLGLTKYLEKSQFFSGQAKLKPLLAQVSALRKTRT